MLKLKTRQAGQGMPEETPQLTVSTQSKKAKAHPRHGVPPAALQRLADAAEALVEARRRTSRGGGGGLRDLLVKQVAMLGEVSKSLSADIDEAKKAGNSAVGDLSKLIVRARSLQASLTAEITKVKGQVQKAQHNAAAARRQAEMQERKKKSEENDAKDLADTLPEVLELVSMAEDSREAISAMPDPTVTEPPEQDMLKRAVEERETAASDAQSKTIEARKQKNLNLQKARRYAPEVQETALSEYSTLQQKLTEAQKRLNPYKTFRQSFKSRVEAKRALADLSEKMDAAELEVEKASLMSSAAEQGQMSEDEVAAAEKLVSPATMAISNALRNLELKMRTADGMLKEELNQMRERGVAAKKKIESVSQVLRRQRDGIAMQQMVTQAAEKAEKAEEALVACNDAETPFLKGIEVLPPEQSTKAISDCEAAAGKAETAINAAKLFVKTKLLEASKKPKEVAKDTLDELKQLMERAEEASKKLAVFKAETLERKTTARLADLMEAIAEGEGKVQALAKICEAFHSENLDDVSTEVLRDALERAGTAEKEAMDACAEARKVIATKQKEPKSDLAAPIAKLQSRLNSAIAEVTKHKKAAEGGSKLIKGKAVISEEQERIRSAEEEVEKVQKVVEASAEGEELPDEAVREMGEAVVTSQKALKSSLTCLNSHLPGAAPAVKASLQKLVERSRKAQEKLNSVLAATKDQRERVLAEAYVKEGVRKAEEVEEAMERVNKAELPFLKGLEFLPVAEANETLKESDAAAAAVQAAIGEARTYIASKNLEVKQFKEEVSKPAAEDFGKQSERINSCAAKLSQFRKDTEVRKKTAQMQEAVERIDTIETEGKALAEAVEPFAKGEVDEMAVEDANELCSKLLVRFKELYSKMDAARIFLAARQKDAKGAAGGVETLHKLQARLSEARVEVAKAKMAVSDRESKIVAKKLLTEANEMVARLEDEVQKASDFSAPLLERGGEEFLVLGSLQKLAAALRDQMGEKGLSTEEVFKQIAGEAGGKVPQEAFLAYLEALPLELKREELTFTEDRRAAIFKKMDAEKEGSVSLEGFRSIFSTRYVCVKTISVTDDFEVLESKTTAKIEPQEVLEAIGNPKVEEATGMTRIECKVVSTGKVGFVTMVGNGGTVYIEAISPFKIFAEEMDKKIEASFKSADKVAAFFKARSSELAQTGKAALAEARAELVKLRLKVSTAAASLDELRKKSAAAKKNFPKREQLDKDAHIEIREKKAAAVISADIAARTEAMEACLKQLESAVGPLASLKGAELDGFATPASTLRQAEELSAAALRSVAEARALREEQLAKVGKAVRGPFVDLKRELQKLELKAAAAQKKAAGSLEAARGACQSIADGRCGRAAAALRAEVQSRGLTNEGLFEELLRPGEDRISEEAFSQHLQSLEGLSLSPEQALLLCRHVEADGVSRRKFLAFLQQYFSVVKAIAITDEFDVASAKILRTADVEEIIEVLEGPTSHEKLGLARIRGRSLTDGVEGWISVKGNQGSTFLQKVMKPFYACTKEVLLERDFKSEGDDGAVRTLQAEEVLELLEGPRKETLEPSLRVRGKAVKDGAIGWLTVKDKKGVVFAEADDKYYSCTTSVAMTDERDIKTCNVIRKLDKGEMLLALAEPVLDEGAGVTRINGKALKDGKVGWITIKGNAGTVYADANSKHYSVLREVALQKSFASAKAPTIRMLEPGEAVQGLEAPKEESHPPEVRMKGRALSDGAVGWITKADNIRPWSPYYKCLEATALRSSPAAEDSEVVRQLAVGEMVELVEGPIAEGEEVRMKGRAEKDCAVGWVTIKAAGGKRLLAC
mmetsp:Transcript_97686/g.285161  ORF Transcript_97686/g.285161 Transcript_97686/m.285161 type:complete len:1813 (+) Transcript_97686:1-5439(+)